MSVSGGSLMVYGVDFLLTDILPLLFVQGVQVLDWP